MLGPLEDSLTENTIYQLNEEQRDRQWLIYRNTLRLLKLVNTLLDFSRLEAHRMQVVYEPSDLAGLTADLVSVFRSTIEKAGLKLFIEIPSIGEPVYIDKEMYEKIIFNLLFNAVKFTFEGAIRISLQKQSSIVELQVQDTGIGIPATELPHIFERFHQVEAAKSRSYEGFGIGLALIQELVKLQGGTIRVESIANQGSTFIITFPLGTAHLSQEQIGKRESYHPGAIAAPFISEASSWLSSGSEPSSALGGTTQVISRILQKKILVADDNQDMCRYLRKLLQPFWQVETVYDGEAALLSVQKQAPDLILSDIMMPKLNGF